MTTTNTRIHSIILTVSFISAMAASTFAAEPPKMKMTTEVPEGVATPDLMVTSLGVLTSFDGVPDDRTTQVVFDNLDFQRAVQAYLSTIQVSSLAAVRTGYLGFGPANTTVMQFEELMDSKALWLTPNTVSVYQACWLELGDEPMVIETPPNVLGFIDHGCHVHISTVVGL